MTKVLLTEEQKIEKGGIAHMRIHRAVVSCTPAEWPTIVAAARQAGKPVAVWLRDVGLDQARAQAAQQVAS